MSNCNCNCNQVKPPIITATLSAGSTTSPYSVLVNITQQLCYKKCAESTPVFNPRFSVVSFAKVSTAQWVATIHCEGIISYVPCNGGCSCTKQQPLSANFTVPFTSATTPTAPTVTQSTTYNAMAVAGCQECSKTFTSETMLALTVV
jgi:hypothetical protein